MFGRVLGSGESGEGAFFRVTRSQTLGFGCVCESGESWRTSFALGPSLERKCLAVFWGVERVERVLFCG